MDIRWRSYGGTSKAERRLLDVYVNADGLQLLPLFVCQVDLLLRLVPKKEEHMMYPSKFAVHKCIVLFVYVELYCLVYFDIEFVWTE